MKWSLIGQLLDIMMNLYEWSLHNDCSTNTGRVNEGLYKADIFWWTIYKTHDLHKHEDNDYHQKNVKYTLE